MSCKQKHFEATNDAAAVYLMASTLATMKVEPHIKYIKGSEEYILITHCNFISPVSRQNPYIFLIQQRHPILLQKIKGSFSFCLFNISYFCMQLKIIPVHLLFPAALPQMETGFSSLYVIMQLNQKKETGLSRSRNQQ